MKVYDKINLTMLCDFYELTMAHGYFENGYKDRITYFDVFYRRCPDGGGFAIAAGLEQIIEYIQELRFEPEDIEYLRGRNLFSDDASHIVHTVERIGSGTIGGHSAGTDQGEAC